MTLVIFKSSLYFIFGENQLSYYMNNKNIYDNIEPNTHSYKRCDFCKRYFLITPILYNAKTKYAICLNCVRGLNSCNNKIITHYKHKMITICLNGRWYASKSLFKCGTKLNFPAYMINCSICNKLNGICKRCQKDPYALLNFYWKRIKSSFITVKAFNMIKDIENIFLHNIVFTSI